MTVFAQDGAVPLESGGVVEKTSFFKKKPTAVLMLAIFVFAVLGGLFLLARGGYVPFFPKPETSSNDNKNLMKAPAFSISGKLISIDVSNPKRHVWTLVNNGRNVAVYLDQPVAKTAFNDYASIKKGDWVHVNWSSYSFIGSDKSPYVESASVAQIYVAQSLDDLLKQSASLSPTTFSYAFINEAVSDLGYTIYWLTEYEDGSGRSTLFGKRVDFAGRPDKLVGCGKDYCKGMISDLVLLSNGSGFTLSLVDPTLKARPTENLDGTNVVKRLPLGTFLISMDKKVLGFETNMQTERILGGESSLEGVGFLNKGNMTEFRAGDIVSLQYDSTVVKKDDGAQPVASVVTRRL